MHFISTFRKQNVVLRHKRRLITETSNMGKVADVVEGIRVEFKPLAEPFETRLLATRGRTGKAWGMLDTREAARENLSPNLVNSEGEPMTIDQLEEVIQQGLMQHSFYGVHWVAIDEHGTMVEDEDRYYDVKDDGGVYCKLCDQHFKNTQGLKGHKRSTEHIENVQAVQETQAPLAAVSH